MTTAEVGAKMAAVALFAELKYRDGRRETIDVSVQNNLGSVIAGIKELNANVSQLLSDLVAREKTHGDCAGEEEEEDSDDEEENNEPQPPAKRTKI